MKTQTRMMGAGGILAAAAIALAAYASAAEMTTSAANGAGWQQWLPKDAGTQAEMSLAQIGVGGKEVSRGDECPVGSGAYCSDESPYCFMCKGDYTCCWTNEVWRCCE